MDPIAIHSPDGVGQLVPVATSLDNQGHRIKGIGGRLRFAAKDHNLHTPGNFRRTRQIG